MSNLIDKPIGFVVPWYGESIPGGAESECRGFCHALQRKGVEVRVFTTCAHDFHSSWQRNTHRPGLHDENGIEVQRFALRRRNKALFDSINRKILNRYPLTPHEEIMFYSESIRSLDLEHFIQDHYENYHLIFMPYCFGTSYFGVQAAKSRCTMLPCLHREGYAFLGPTRMMLNKTGGLIFNAAPERDLAAELVDLDSIPQITLGMGVGSRAPGNAAAFRKKFKQERPFFLYVGRLDPTKNVPTLIKYFLHLINNSAFPADLMLIGAGDLDIPSHARKRIVRLGVVSEEDKLNAMAAATAVVQPSLNESFAIVLMEAWREGTPVVVNELCDVTLQKSREAGGGLYFKNFLEFREVCEYLLTHEREAKHLGAQGKAFINEHHQWDRIVDKLCQFLRERQTLD